ncbi:heme exporter protein CcmD [Pseudofulvimonas gallinarii]|jgi:heme exporter protein D|uniref:Heme exporter protein D n=1 Tax=Pseudofulvimonas gallinarii TaxID=634155 RepID=A0A4R3LJI6_9GAMM|nr:heme exporter protein CcmD [Pseudofulvimonas gallinarii]TCS99648.1 heme exporter protein D [Pseudofulvimonas gallinarii]THD15313.1 heme exporter protein CcmD [Pseudofulvimonas gallinarii]
MAEWFAMGGYGGYVWGAYLASFIVLAWDIVAPWRKRRELRRRRPARPSRRSEHTPT